MNFSLGSLQPMQLCFVHESESFCFVLEQFFIGPVGTKHPERPCAALFCIQETFLFYFSTSHPLSPIYFAGYALLISTFIDVRPHRRGRHSRGGISRWVTSGVEISYELIYDGSYLQSFARKEIIRYSLGIMIQIKRPFSRSDP
jgi:hypothetical protein